MDSSENFILINYKRVAQQLANRHFQEQFEDKLPWETLYEQIDETGNWYLKTEFQLILDAILQDTEEFLLEHDITNSLSI